MPLSKEHKQKTRENILKSSVALFCRQGYAAVSIDDLMQHAQLTRGAFYAHFKSKSDVYMQSIIAAAANSDIIKDLPKHLKYHELLSFFIENYLSLTHVNQKCSPCPMAFLVTDVASKDLKIRRAYTSVFERFIELINVNLPEEFRTEKRQEISIAVSALVIGSVAIARSLDDDTLQKKLLKNSKKIAMQLVSA